MRSDQLRPVVSSCLAIFLIATVAVTPIVDTWIQSVDVNFIEEISLTDSQETKSESSVQHLLSVNHYEIGDLGSGFSSFIPRETSSSHGFKATANSPRGPPIAIA
jgi:hypothetical protein